MISVLEEFKVHLMAAQNNPVPNGRQNIPVCLIYISHIVLEIYSSSRLSCSTLMSLHRSHNYLSCL